MNVLRVKKPRLRQKKLLWFSLMNENEFTPEIHAVCSWFHTGRVPRCIRARVNVSRNGVAQRKATQDASGVLGRGLGTRHVLHATFCRAAF